MLKNILLIVPLVFSVSSYSYADTVHCPPSNFIKNEAPYITKYFAGPNGVYVSSSRLQLINGRFWRAIASMDSPLEDKGNQELMVREAQSLAAQTLVFGDTADTWDSIYYSCNYCQSSTNCVYAQNYPEFEKTSEDYFPPQKINCDNINGYHCTGYDTSLFDFHIPDLTKFVPGEYQFVSATWSYRCEGGKHCGHSPVVYMYQNPNSNLPVYLNAMPYSPFSGSSIMADIGVDGWVITKSQDDYEYSCVKNTSNCPVYKMRDDIFGY